MRKKEALSTLVDEGIRYCAVPMYEAAVLVSILFQLVLSSTP